MHGVQSITDLMVRPGLINLDFADVETVMSSMGKAMMGTGQAEGEDRAIKAAEMAISNPLIDDYTLKGAKGLLVNITGGKDLKLFEVDEAVNKVRAEVDPEAELIIGAITDSEMQGKMRVSIVATALDNQSPQTKPVVNLVHRMQNRNNIYREGVAKNFTANKVTLNATEGATALDLNTAVEQNKATEEITLKDEKRVESVSLENANYLQTLENNSENNVMDNDTPNFEVESIELASPQLFSDEEMSHSTNENHDDQTNEIKMFDQTIPEENTEELYKDKEPEMFSDADSEEDFEIPAFLRRQKN